MTAARASRINSAVFFTVMLSILAAILGGPVPVHAATALPGVVALIIVALCLIVGRRETALRRSERAGAFAHRTADKPLPTRDQDD